MIQSNNKYNILGILLIVIYNNFIYNLYTIYNVLSKT